VNVTWREKHAAEDSSMSSFRAADQIGAESITGCSDLLDEFLRAISRMESEYLRAALEGEKI
jgi:hypothetical protein